MQDIQFRKETLNILANGMVINPKAALEELEMLKKGGVEEYKHICTECRNEIYLEEIYPYWETELWRTKINDRHTNY